MTPKEKEMVLCIIEDEGFDYTFDCYSNFREIKDEKFHQLRKDYLKARNEFEKYIVNK